MVQPLWRTVWRFLKKLKIELPYVPAIPILGIYPEKTIIQKDTCTSIFIAALFTIARTYIYIYIYIYIHTHTHTTSFICIFITFYSITKNVQREKKPPTICILIAVSVHEWEPLDGIIPECIRKPLESLINKYC